MDEKGYFYIVDRKKDMIIASGFNIYPREIEEVLYEHPAVQEAVVAGVPDPYRGETVKAYIVLKEGHSVTEKEMDILPENIWLPIKCQDCMNSVMNCRRQRLVKSCVVN